MEFGVQLAELFKRGHCRSRYTFEPPQSAHEYPPLRAEICQAAAAQVRYAVAFARMGRNHRFFYDPGHSDPLS
jgi:hypothetical protein